MKGVTNRDVWRFIKAVSRASCQESLIEIGERRLPQERQGRYEDTKSKNKGDWSNSSIAPYDVHALRERSP